VGPIQQPGQCSLSAKFPRLKTLVMPLNITYMSSEKVAALDLPQLGLRFLADSNSWNVNGNPHNFETDPQ